jgi:hypothetical protein
MYFDVSLGVMSNNLHAGAGYVHEDGSVEPTWTMLGTRELHKRLFTMLRSREPRGSTRIHISGQPNCAYLGFAEMMVDWENTDSWLTHEKPAYKDYVRLDMFRAQTLGRQFGTVNWYLPQNRRSLPKARENWLSVYPNGGRESQYIFGLALLHNTAIWQAYFPLHYLEPTYEALRAAELNNYSYDYSGYWEQKSVTARPGVPVSIYRAKERLRQNAAKDRALLVLFNNTDYEGEVTLSVDWEDLYMKPSEVTVASPAPTDSPVSIDEKGSIRCVAEPYNFRLIALKRK